MWLILCPIIIAAFFIAGHVFRFAPVIKRRYLALRKEVTQRLEWWNMSLVELCVRQDMYQITWIMQSSPKSCADSSLILCGDVTYRNITAESPLRMLQITKRDKNHGVHSIISLSKGLCNLQERLVASFHLVFAISFMIKYIPQTVWTIHLLYGPSFAQQFNNVSPQYNIFWPVISPEAPKSEAGSCYASRELPKHNKDA